MPPVKIRLPRTEPVGIHGTIEELDLREEFEELMDNDPNIEEIDMREEFEDWFLEYNPNKRKRNVKKRQ